MSGLLFTSDYTMELTDCLRKSELEVVVCSAYSKLAATKKLLSNISDHVDVSIVTRWEKNDLLCGSSDIELYKWSKERGFRFGVNTSLHAKFFFLDRNTIFLGSANISHRGLGYSDNANIEVGTKISATNYDVQKVDCFLNNEVQWISDELFEGILRELESCEEMSAASPDEEWSDGLALQLAKPVVFLWTSELLVTTPANLLTRSSTVERIDADMLLLGLDPKKIPLEEELRGAFQGTRLYKWIVELFRDETAIRHGAFREKLQSNLLDENVPYRQEVSEYVVVMFEWIKFLPDVFEVFRPNHSEIVRLKKND